MGKVGGLNEAASANIFGLCFSLSRQFRPFMSSSLLDQSDLAANAERLVTAARRAGADQADALAIRAVSLSVDVRDGAVEESQRSEGDDLGLRVLVGNRQAVVSTNDLKADALPRWPNVPSPWRARRRKTVTPGSPMRPCSRKSSPTLDLSIPICRTSASRNPPREAEEAGACGRRRNQIRRSVRLGRHRGLVLVTSHGFSGTTIASRHGAR